MSRIASLLVPPLMLLILAGCQGKTVHCDMCNKDVPVGTYCTKCQMVVGLEGTVHCDKCGKDMPAGKYCPKCNRIMMPGVVHCARCGKDVPKGSYCEICKMYAGLPKLAYCEQCKAPYNKAKGCPTCGKKECSSPCGDKK